jgi:4'-phosphopantetheinyl transferase EntD
MPDIPPLPAELFPQHLFSAVSTRSCQQQRVLYDQEHKLVKAATPRRQAEFAAGRHCARLALSHLGIEPQPILKDPAGAPLWPHRIVGSISHTQDLIAAVVARRQKVLAVGIDVEYRRHPFPIAMLEQICVAEELTRLHSLSPAERELQAFLLFSAKESFYKAVYSATGFSPGFQDVRIDIDLAKGRLSGSLCRAHLSMQGRLSVGRNHVVTGIWWPNRASNQHSPNAH